MDFGQYMNLLIIRLRSSWFAQVAESGRQSEKGRSIIQCDIDRDGKVHNVGLVSGSGIADLDSAAQRAIEKASPYGKLPANFTDDVIKIRVEFYNNLKPQK